MYKRQQPVLLPTGLQEHRLLQINSIPPFLLESIIPGKAVFSPLSFIFWRGIIWIPEMRGKGVSKIDSVLDFFSCAWVLERVQKLVPIFFYNFWSQFWIPFFGGLGFFGCLLGAILGLLRLS